MIDKVNKDSKLFIDSVSAQSLRNKSFRENSSDQTVKSFAKNYFTGMVDEVIKNCDSYASALSGRTLASIVNQINNQAPNSNKMVASNKLIELKSNNSIKSQNQEFLKKEIESQSNKQIEQFKKLSQKEITDAIRSHKDIASTKSHKSIKNNVIQEVVEKSLKNIGVDKDVALEVIQNVTKSEIERISNKHIEKIYEKVTNQENSPKFEMIQKNKEVMS